MEKKKSYGNQNVHAPKHLQQRSNSVVQKDIRSMYVVQAKKCLMCAAARVEKRIGWKRGERDTACMYVFVCVSA